MASPNPNGRSLAWLDPYHYDLPEEQIARRPAVPRDSSRLLVLDRATGARSKTTFRNLPRFLLPGDLLVLNETRVVPARLRTSLERTDRAVEVLLSHPDGDEWLAMLGPSRRLKPGDRLTVEAPVSLGAASAAAADGDASVGPDAGAPPVSPKDVLILVAPAGDGIWRLRAEGDCIESIMERAGHVPLPPYLGRDDRTEDRAWYQTVFAREKGAVAAPTAGLHFTEELLRIIEEQGIGVVRVILHVGPGTFLPVRAESPEDHHVLPERYQIPEETAEAVAAARSRGGRVIAVGTTTVRALETAAASGAAGSAAPSDSAASAGAAGRVTPGGGWASLTILPGYRFRVVDALLTNFHLPRSSLLLLVAALAGRERVLGAYAEAREAGFRFYSYGDAMFIV